MTGHDVARRAALFAAQVYAGSLIMWALLRALVGDRYWWTFLLNAFALYLFAPLPAVTLYVLLARNRRGSVLAGAAIALWVQRYGILFVPKGHPHVGDRGAMGVENDLVVMTFNVLVHNAHPDRVVTAIRASNADVVGLQELNPAIADAIGRQLDHAYPYQILVPDSESAAGMGVISRYPLHPTGETIPGVWLGAPQVLALSFGERRVTALNLHPVSSTANPTTTRREARDRARVAAAIVAYVRAHPYPVIVTTDFNASDQNEPYAIMTRALGDAWREAGWGLGHTFPGASSPGSSRPHVLGVAVPQWLVRIDYVFHSRDWRAHWARIGPWDGISDHRPVLACLTLPD